MAFEGLNYPEETKNPRCKYEQHINEYFGKEMFDSYSRMASVFDIIDILCAWDQKKEKGKPQYALKEFVLAALTGLASNSGYSDNNWPDDWDDYVDRLATGSKEIAKAAFELYEKEAGHD